MKLNLKKPIVFFDLETTGVSVSHDKIIMIGYIKVYPNGNEESKTIYVKEGIYPRSLQQFTILRTKM